jgi:hypothetical protein
MIFRAEEVVTSRNQKPETRNQNGLFWFLVSGFWFLEGSELSGAKE